MKKKIYRWMEYNKWFLITMMLGMAMISWITSCQPSQHNDVQMRTFHTDTVSTPDTTVKEVK
ncbi:hypothetical protein CMI37_02535 [Candidatus Pacearchaeota archaeon]|nr:hypothetical protein [Candidatus Pacearchaeota archaeon]